MSDLSNDYTIVIAQNGGREGLDDDEITNLRNTELWNQPGRAPLIVSESGFYRRVLTDEQGEPWFVGKDVAKVLGYANASKALADHVDHEDRLNNESLSSLGQRGGWLINESGIYSLILSSKLNDKTSSSFGQRGATLINESGLFICSCLFWPTGSLTYYDPYIHIP